MCCAMISVPCHPFHKMGPEAFELEGSQLDGVCGVTYQRGVKDSSASLWTDLLPCGFS